MTKICAYIMETTPPPPPATGSKRQAPEQPQSIIVGCLADQERAGLAEPIRTDARRNGKVGQIVVWTCEGVLCHLNCQKHINVDNTIEAKGEITNGN